MELIGKIQSFPFVIKEGNDMVIANCKINVYGMQAELFHPIEGHIRRVKLTEGIMEAYLVLNHLKVTGKYDIKITKIPDEILEALDTSNAEDGAVF